MITQKLQERISLVEALDGQELDRTLLHLELARKATSKKAPESLEDPGPPEHWFFYSFICTLISLASWGISGLLWFAIHYEEHMTPIDENNLLWEGLTNPWMVAGALFAACVIGYLAIHFLEKVETQKIEEYHKRQREIKEWQKFSQLDVPVISTLSFVQKRRLLINYFRDMVADVRHCTLGPESEVMKTENSINENREGAHSTLGESVAIRDSGELSELQIEVLNLQIAKLERLIERFDRILDAHHQGKEVIISRLRAFETALGLLDPEGAVQHIVDKTQELEWAADRLEAESTESLLRVVQHLAGYMTRVSNGLQSLSSYTFDAIDVQDGEGEKVFIHLSDESTQELSSLLEEVVPDPRELALIA